MLADSLARGLKSGIVAGLVFGLFVAVAVAPLVSHADQTTHELAGSGHTGDVHPDAQSHADAGATEGTGHSDQNDHSHDGTPSLAVTKTVSILSGGLWAVLLGCVFFGVIYYVAEPAIPGAGTTKSYVLGGMGFVTVSGAPWLVVPPTPPGAKQSLPVDTRLLLYAGMMVAGLLACVLAGIVYNRLEATTGRPAAAVGAVVSLAVVAIPAMIAPTNAVQTALSAELQAGLLGLFVFGQVLLWLVLATVHARLQSTAETNSDPSPTATTAVDVAD
jgi:hypothetical protein